MLLSLPIIHSRFESTAATRSIRRFRNINHLINQQPMVLLAQIRLKQIRNLKLLSNIPPIHSLNIESHIQLILTPRNPTKLT